MSRGYQPTHSRNLSNPTYTKPANNTRIYTHSRAISATNYPSSLSLLNNTSTTQPTYPSHKRNFSYPRERSLLASDGFQSRIPKPNKNSISSKNFITLPNSTKVVYLSQIRSPESRIPLPPNLKKTVSFNQQIMNQNKSNVSPNSIKNGSNLSSPSTNKKPLRKIPLGTRVFTKKGHFTGILRFAGRTQFKEGIWAGIELDKVGTGKNNGSINGVKYFECPENTGIFIDYKLISPIEEKGTSLDILYENSQINTYNQNYPYHSNSITESSHLGIDKSNNNIELNSKQLLERLENPELSPINKSNLTNRNRLSLNGSILSNQDSLTNSNSSDPNVDLLKHKLVLLQKQNHLLQTRLKKKQADTAAANLLRKEFIDKAREKLSSQGSSPKHSRKNSQNQSTLLESINEKEDKLNEMAMKLEQTENELQILKSQLEIKQTGSLEITDSELASQLQEKQIEIQSLQEELRILQDEIITKEDIINSLKDELEQTKALITNTDIDLTKGESQIKLASLMKELEELKKESFDESFFLNQKLKEALDNLASESAKYSTEVEKNNELKLSLEEATKEVDSLKEKIAELENARRDIEELLNQAEAQSQEAVSKFKLQIETLEQENNHLKSQVENIQSGPALEPKESLNELLVQLKEKEDIIKELKEANELLEKTLEEYEEEEGSEDYSGSEEGEDEIEDDESKSKEVLLAENHQLQIQINVLKDSYYKVLAKSSYPSLTTSTEIPKEDREQEIAELQKKILDLEEKLQTTREISEKTMSQLSENGEEADEATKELLILKNTIQRLESINSKLSTDLNSRITEYDEMNEEFKICMEEKVKLEMLLEEKITEVDKMKETIKYESNRAEEFKNALKQASSGDDEKMSYYENIIKYEETISNLMVQLNQLYDDVYRRDQYIAELTESAQLLDLLNQEGESKGNDLEDGLNDKNLNRDDIGSLTEESSSLFCYKCFQHGHDQTTCHIKDTNLPNDNMMLDELEGFEDLDQLDVGGGSLFDEIKKDYANTTSVERVLDKEDLGSLIGSSLEDGFTEELIDSSVKSEEGHYDVF